MFGSPTIYEPIIASMYDSSCESRNQNILFITWKIFTFLFDSLSRRFIILCSVRMMYSFVLLFVTFTLIYKTISRKVSSLVTCKASVFRYISTRSSRVIFLVRMLTFGMMIVPYDLLGVYHESLIFISHLVFSRYYSSFFLWAFLPHPTKSD